MKKNLNLTVQTEFETEIIEIIRSNLVPKKMQEKIGAYHEKDVAQILDRLTAEERQRLFRVLAPEEIARVLEYAENPAAYFEQLGIRRKTDVLSMMETPAAVALLKLLTKEERASLLELVRPDVREELYLISSFDEEQVGSRMSANYIAISDRLTVKEAMAQLVRQAAENDNIGVIYVVDETKIFCGAIDLKDLIIAREGTPLSQITILSYPYLYARASVESAIPFFRAYSEHSIPVLDDGNRLLGVVTARDFVEIIGDELNEDYAKLAGLSQEEGLTEPIVRSIRKRMPWLCILLVLGLGVSAVVGLFESVVAQLPVIMCFQSLILDMAGNVGTQSLAVAIRVLMDTRIGHREKWTLIGREARIGLLNGAILGAISFAAIGGYLCVKGNTVGFAFSVSGCLGAAMLLAMLISSLSGTVIPIFFEKIGVDPAVASGPLITTVNDLVAVVTYYGLAWLILIRLMRFA